MTVLWESPLVIVVTSGLLAIFALVVFLARRDAASLAALAGVVAVALLMLLVERFVVTEREAVEAAVDGVFAAIEANDLAGVLSWIDPAAGDVRTDVKTMMPMIEVREAHAMGSVEVEFDAGATPLTAASRIRGFLDGVHKSSGQRVPYINQQIDVEWVKRGDRWLIDGYTAYFEGRPIDAVGSRRSNRPVTGR